jgi:protein subunit release factor A
MQAKKRAEAVQRQELYRLKAPLMEELARLEARLAELGKRLDEVTADLAAPENYQDQDRSRELNREFRRLRDENEKATAAWERAALRLEALGAAQEPPEP